MYLDMKNITMEFGPVTALDNVSLHVGESEIHGLLGENGAGKSTLMNILAGTFPPVSGEIYINGEQITNMTTKKSHELGIRFIHQELNLVNDLRVYENLFLGEEITKGLGFVDKKEMIRRSDEVFERMNVDIDSMNMVSELDTSHKQLVEIAKALLVKSSLIIMDEPTTALTNTEIQNLFSIMGKLKNQGVSIIYISHKMPELFAVCDRYTVLRDGKFIDSGNFSEIDEKKATELLVGRKLIDAEIPDRTLSEEVVLRAENLSAYPYFENINFELRKGEVIAITGLHGDGRGELAEALFGDRKLSTGDVYIYDKKLNKNSIKSAMKSGVGMVPRNRKERSIIKDMNILDNLAMAFFTSSHKGIIRRIDEEERFEKNRKITSIKIGNPYDNINSLSGGNQQKIIIGRWLEAGSKIYILDNPTQGIDVGAKFEIYSLINSLAQAGKSIIIFSAEFPEIYKVADRCLVMYKGKIQAELSRENLTEVNVMYYATGGGNKNDKGE